MADDWTTPDLYDAHEGEVSACALQFRGYGGRARFCGPAATVRCCEDNSLVRKALEEPGDGRVLVVDGGGSLRCALVGGNIARLAADNGWAGIVVDGAVRDTAEIAACDIGVFAVGTCPARSRKQSSGSAGVTLVLGGAVCRPGDWVYCDPDGMLVAPRDLGA